MLKPPNLVKGKKSSGHVHHKKWKKDFSVVSDVEEIESGDPLPDPSPNDSRFFFSEETKKAPSSNNQAQVAKESEISYITIPHQQKNTPKLLLEEPRDRRLTHADQLLIKRVTFKNCKANKLDGYKGDLQDTKRCIKRLTDRATGNPLLCAHFEYNDFLETSNVQI
jgi:hypothetical protein